MRGMMRLAIMGVPGAQGGEGVLPFDQQILALPGLLAYWPQTETEGLVADNAEGTAERDAAYYTDANVNQAAQAFPVGDNVAWYLFSGRLRFGTTNLAAAWNWDDFWVVLWGLPDETEQAGSGKHFWAYFTGGTSLTLGKTGADPYWFGVDHRPDDLIGNRLFLGDWVYSPNFTQIAVHVHNGAGYIWRNGTLVVMNPLIDPSTIDTLNISNVDYNVLAAGVGATGAFPHFAVGANAALTTDHVNNLYEAVYPDAKSIFVCGDSFATNNDYWISKTVGDLEYATPGEVWRERPYRIGLSGQRVAALHAELDANINSYVGTPDVCLVHIGTNDVGDPAIDEVAFKADLRGVIEALYGKWSKPVYCALPYRADGDYDAACAAVATWITSVCGEYAYAHVGPDYTASWWKDNLATLSDDNVHPNTAGHIAIAAQWAAILTA